MDLCLDLVAYSQILWINEFMERPGRHDKPAFQATIEVQAHVIKKNSRTIFRNRTTGRLFPGKDKRLKDAENFLVSELRHRAITSGLQQPLTGRLRALLWFYFPKNVFYTAKGVESKRLGDCTNLSQIYEDALQSAGVIKNDSQLAPIELDRKPSDDNTHKVLIELYE